MNTLELELKLTIAPNNLDAAHQTLAKQRSIIEQTSAQLANIYYDDPNFSLASHKIGFRVRSNNKRCEQTVKLAGQEHNGIHHRPEYNLPLQEMAPDILAFDNNIWPDTLDIDKVCNQLQEVFQTNFNRNTLLIELAHGNSIEVAIDSGEIIANGDSSAISEIELESKGAPLEAIIALANQLAAHIPLRLGQASKAKRGYQLSQNQLNKQPSIAMDNNQNAPALFRQLLSLDDFHQDNPANETSKQQHLALRQVLCRHFPELNQEVAKLTVSQCYQHCDYGLWQLKLLSLL